MTKFSHVINLLALALTPLAALAADPAAPQATATPKPAPPPASEQVTLTIPANIMDLPKAPSQRYTVHMVAGPEELVYHHGATVEVWKGRLYVAWHAAFRSEDTPPYFGMVTSAPLDDLTNWRKPVAVSHINTTAYEQYMRERYSIPQDKGLIVGSPTRLLHATPDKLYLWCLGWVSTENNHYEANRDPAGRIFWTADGETWNEIPPKELDALVAEKGLGSLRDSGSNHNFLRLRDGRLMAYNLNKGLWCPTTTDTTGLTSWQGGLIDSTDAGDVGEPGGWEGPDGVLHGTSRWNERIWHAFSRDGGKTWSRLAEQPGFSDCPGNKDFGTMPDGRVWYVGNPVPNSRDQLVLGISNDGWHFDQSWLVRWEPTQQLYPWTISNPNYKGKGGFQYPDATFHDGTLYAAYSIQREGIEVSAIKLADLPGVKPKP